MTLGRRFLNKEAADEARRVLGSMDPRTRARYTVEMDRVCSDPFYARPLLGELADCDKVYVAEVQGDGDLEDQPSWRVVFRYMPSREDPEYVEVICIGPRIGLTVYGVARALLGRQPGGPAI